MGSLEGRTLGHFRVERLIGRGGMGAVYEAVDEKLERSVALKVLLQEGDSELAKKRFLREARLAAKITHPNIASVFEVGEFESHLYIVMEMLEGHSLRKLLAKRRLSADEALGLGREVARALARAHAGGVAHRDIKPENIFVTTPAPNVLHAKVLDFGLARQQKASKAPAPEGRRSEEHTATDATAPGDIIGTPGYWSPEQARAGTVDLRTDIFSFGLVLYEMLAGKKAFSANTTVALVLAVTRHEPEPLKKHMPNASPELEDLIARCLAKDPAHRFADGAELLEALEGIARESARLSLVDHDGDTAADASGPPVVASPRTSDPKLPPTPQSTPAQSTSSPTPGGSAYDDVPSALIRPRERFRFIVAAGLGLVVAAVLVVVVVSVWSSSDSATASAATSPASVSALPSASAAPIEATGEAPAASSPSPSVSITPTPLVVPPTQAAPAVAAPLGATAPAGSTRARTNRKGDCAQPFTIDSKGVKIPKLHCL